jgi:hypothetical protein
MTAKVSNVVSVKEVPIPSGATVLAGMMVVNSDSNGVVVVPATGTAQVTSGTLTSSAVLNFGANNVPAYVVPGMVVRDLTTPAAITTQTVLSVQASAGTVTLSAVVSAAVITGDIISFGETAGTLAAALGCSAIKTVDVVARSGAFPDTGKPIFD